jgi:DNA-binding CsgD family transcriptional regulator
MHRSTDPIDPQNQEVYALWDQLAEFSVGDSDAALTPAERRVLLALLDGQTEKEIAQRLDQSPNTTHFHVKSIYAKFGVRNRATLTALWLGKLR